MCRIERLQEPELWSLAGDTKESHRFEGLLRGGKRLRVIPCDTEDRRLGRVVAGLGLNVLRRPEIREPRKHVARPVDLAAVQVDLQDAAQRPDQARVDTELL